MPLDDWDSFAAGPTTTTSGSSWDDFASEWDSFAAPVAPTGASRQAAVDAHSRRLMSKPRDEFGFMSPRMAAVAERTAPRIGGLRSRARRHLSMLGPSALMYPGIDDIVPLPGAYEPGGQVFDVSDSPLLGSFVANPIEAIVGNERIFQTPTDVHTPGLDLLGNVAAQLPQMTKNVALAGKLLPKADTARRALSGGLTGAELQLRSEGIEDVPAIGRAALGGVAGGTLVPEGVRSGLFAIGADTAATLAEIATRDPALADRAYEAVTTDAEMDPADRRALFTMLGPAVFASAFGSASGIADARAGREARAVQDRADIQRFKDEESRFNMESRATADQLRADNLRLMTDREFAELTPDERAAMEADARGVEADWQRGTLDRERWTADQDEEAMRLLAEQAAMESRLGEASGLGTLMGDEGGVMLPGGRFRPLDVPPDEQAMFGEVQRRMDEADAQDRVERGMLLPTYEPVLVEGEGRFLPTEIDFEAEMRRAQEQIPSRIAQRNLLEQAPDAPLKMEPPVSPDADPTFIIRPATTDYEKTAVSIVENAWKRGKESNNPKVRRLTAAQMSNLLAKQGKFVLPSVDSGELSSSGGAWEVLPFTISKLGNQYLVARVNSAPTIEPVASKRTKTGRVLLPVPMEDIPVAPVREVVPEVVVEPEPPMGPLQPAAPVAPKPTKAPIDISEWPPARLKKESEKASELTSALNEEMIAAGRGTELPHETRKKTDPLSLRWQAAMDAQYELSKERQRRMEYSGSLNKTTPRVPTRGVSSGGVRGGRLSRRSREGGFVSWGRGPSSGPTRTGTQIFPKLKQVADAYDRAAKWVGNTIERVIRRILKMRGSQTSEVQRRAGKGLGLAFPYYGAGAEYAEVVSRALSGGRLAEHLKRAGLMQQTDKAFKLANDKQRAEYADLLQGRIRPEDAVDLTPEMIDAVVKERAFLDGLTDEMVARGIPSEVTKVIMDARKGEYTRRIYYASEDPTFAGRQIKRNPSLFPSAVREVTAFFHEQAIQRRVNQIMRSDRMAQYEPDEALALAREQAESEGVASKTPEEVATFIKELIATKANDADAERQPTGTSGKHQLRSPFMPRSDLFSASPTLRTIFGEVKDPFEIFDKTSHDMAEVIVRDQFQRDLAGSKDIDGQPFVKDAMDEATGHTVPLDDSFGHPKTLGVLSGKWVRPQTADALNDYWGGVSFGAVGKMINTLRKPFYFSNTAGSTGTQGANFLTGALMDSVLAKNWIMNPANWGFYYRAAKAIYNRTESPEYATAARHGALKENAPDPVLGERVFPNLATYLDKGHTVPQWIAKMISQVDQLPVLKQAAAIYRSTDTLFRLSTWLKFRGQMGDAEAARYVNELFPDYDRVPTALKWAAKVPVAGPFLAYGFDMPRRMMNAARRNPVTASVFTGILASLDSGYPTLDEQQREDWDKARELLNDYEYGGFSVPLNVKGKLVYLNLDRIIPASALYNSMMGKKSGMTSNMFMSYPEMRGLYTAVTGQDPRGYDTALPDTVPLTERLAAAAAQFAKSSVPPLTPGMGYEAERIKNADVPDAKGRVQRESFAWLGALTGVRPKDIQWDARYRDALAGVFHDLRSNEDYIRKEMKKPRPDLDVLEARFTAYAKVYAEGLARMDRLREGYDAGTRSFPKSVSDKFAENRKARQEMLSSLSNEGSLSRWDRFRTLEREARMLGVELPPGLLDEIKAKAVEKYPPLGTELPQTAVRNTGMGLDAPPLMAQ